MRTMIAAAIVIATLAAPAYAQRKDAGGQKEPDQLTPMQQIERGKKLDREAADRQYEQRAKIPETSATYDPWRGVRPAPGEKR